MPFKLRLKQGKFSKNSKYKVVNNKEYNQSLNNRGKISFYLPAGNIKELFINYESYIHGTSGRSDKYSESYIELLFVLYKLQRVPLRQFTGFMGEYWDKSGFDLEVLSFGHLISYRFQRLAPKVKSYAYKAKKGVEEGQELALIMDSSGLRMYYDSAWLEEKYPAHKKRRSWRKLHLGRDGKNEILAIELTCRKTDERKVAESFIESLAFDSVIAKGSYYSNEFLNKIPDGIVIAIPPSKNEVIRNKENTQKHDATVKYVKEKGKYAFYKKNNYGRRCLVEAQFSRIKRCLGSKLKTRNMANQKMKQLLLQTSLTGGIA